MQAQFGCVVPQIGADGQTGSSQYTPVYSGPLPEARKKDGRHDVNTLSELHTFMIKSHHIIMVIFIIIVKNVYVVSPWHFLSRSTQGLRGILMTCCVAF